MGTNTVPRFTEKGILGVAEVSVANTSRDGTGAMETIVTSAANGTLIQLIRVEAGGTTTAGMIRLFLHDGSTAWLYTEILVAAVTPSGTVAVFAQELAPSVLVLPEGWSLRAATNNAEAFNVFAFGGDF